MCSPSMALGAQAAGAASSAVGSIFGAIGQKAGLKAQARMAELNAQMLDEDARYARMRGAQEETSLRLSAAQLKSRQKASMGANNVDMSEGSALNTLVSTDYMTESDAITIQRNTAHEARAIRAGATSKRNEAIMARGEASGISPLMSGVTSLIGGAGQVASSWYSMNKAGAFSKPSLGYDFGGF